MVTTWRRGCVWRWRRGCMWGWRRAPPHLRTWRYRFHRTRPPPQAPRTMTHAGPRGPQQPLTKHNVFCVLLTRRDAYPHFGGELTSFALWILL